MKDNLRDLTEKLNNHDDSLFSINTNVSNMKIDLDGTHNTLDNARKDQDLL